MATILLAVADPSLRDACIAQLEAAGHASLRLDRPLASLVLSRTVIWDATCVDSSDLGVETLRTLAGASQPVTPVVGLGLEESALTASIPLPLVEQRLLSTISEVTSLVHGPASRAKPERLRLDPERRLAVSQGLEVALTRTEFLLLDVLYERRPREVGLMEVLQTVWGFTEGRGTSELVRSHVRNLRLKLAKIGLPDAVQSRRGRGYALTA